MPLILNIQVRVIELLRIQGKKCEEIRRKCHTLCDIQNDRLDEDYVHILYDVHDVNPRRLIV
jgi:hypothetical protein